MGNQEFLSESEIQLVDIFRDPDGFIRSLSPMQKVAFQLWRRSGDIRLATVVFPKQFPEQPVLALRIHTPPASNQFSLFRI